MMCGVAIVLTQSNMNGASDIQYPFASKIFADRPGILARCRNNSKLVGAGGCAARPTCALISDPDAPHDFQITQRERRVLAR